MDFFYRRQTELIADFDERIATVHAFVGMGDALMLQTGSGTVSILPGALSLLESAARRSWGPRRPDVDHRQSERAREVSPPRSSVS